jgi:hypothetical protein
MPNEDAMPNDAREAPWQPSQRYPDPSVQIIDQSFARYRPRYVIVPERDIPAGLVEQLNSHGPAVRMYRDEFFSVFQLGDGGSQPIR